MKLTKSIVDRAKYEGESHEGSDGQKKWSRYVLWDDDVRGLGLRITPKGKKSFVLSYRVGNRKRLLTMGPYGVLTLQEARVRAMKELAAILDGHDPLAVREEVREAPTVKALGERYLEEHAYPKKKPKSAEEDRRQLEKYIEPALGKVQVSDLTTADCARLHHSMRDTPIQANRVRALLSKMCSLAETWGLRPKGSNPVNDVERFKERKRERYLSTEELERLGKVLAEMEAEGQEPQQAITAVRLLLLTGCRRDEILKLRWKEVDFERRFLLVPDSKTGAKVVPVGSAVIDLLRTIPRQADNPYVLPGRNGTGRFVGLFHVWVRIRDRAGISDVRIHDLRHSFASVGVGSGHGLPILGKLLGHRDSATTARYAHLAADPLLAAADQISEEIGRKIAASSQRSS